MDTHLSETPHPRPYKNSTENRRLARFLVSLASSKPLQGGTELSERMKARLVEVRRDIESDRAVEGI